MLVCEQVEVRLQNTYCRKYKVKSLTDKGANQQRTIDLHDYRGPHLVFAIKICALQEWKFLLLLEVKFCSRQLL